MKKIIAISALSLMTVTAFAETKTDNGLSYNEIGVAYVSQEATNETTNTFNGYGISGSFLLTDSVYANVSYGSTSHDFTTVKISIAQTKFGLGYRYALAESTDLNVFGTYSNSTVTLNSDTTNYGVGVGVRTVALNPDLELGVNYIYSRSTVDNVNTNKSSYLVGVKYKLPGDFFVGADYFSTKDLSQYTLGVGYKF